jgi:hypothetical protein
MILGGHTAWCDPQVVDASWLTGNRLQPPKVSASVEAPKGWVWLEVPASEGHRDFAAVEPGVGRKFVFSVATEPTVLSETLVKDFAEGLRHQIVSSGGRVKGLTTRPSAIPVPGSYCVMLHAVGHYQPSSYAFGYMAPGPPVVFLEEFRKEPGPSQEFLAFVESLRTGAR